VVWGRVGVAVILLGCCSLAACGSQSVAVTGHPSTVPHPPASTVPRSAVPSTNPTSTSTTSAPLGRLAGKVIVIDPGHNGGDGGDPSFINQLVWNGRESEACDTTGTETDGGYTEAQFNWNVAQYLEADLQGLGATVVLTRSSNTGVGPCITQRAAIGNQAHADAALSIHADGGPPAGRGFAVLEPVADGTNDAIITPSQSLGADLIAAFAPATSMPISNYDGEDGVASRDDLAGLNLSTVPKVFIECGNMRNATDAAMLVSPAWQMQAAQALATGLANFVLGTHS